MSDVPVLLMSQTTTTAPSLANLRERSLPSPLPPPVTSAISPETLFILYFIGVNNLMIPSTIAISDSNKNPMISPVDRRNDIFFLL